jgi:hypothetical protein
MLSRLIIHEPQILSHSKYISAESKRYHSAGEVRNDYISIVAPLLMPLNSNSTLLKSDQWLSESHHVERAVRGAMNFRQVPNTNIYALGQPSLEAIDEVVARIKDVHPSASDIVWINLREEPVVYINGAPYCLRREGFSLRNMKGTIQLLACYPC